MSSCNVVVAATDIVIPAVVVVVVVGICTLILYHGPLEITANLYASSKSVFGGTQTRIK
ncbi:MAG TPA: hypothetical protein VE619_04600 [Nitrososphaeraceae archaeon]|nr:hypothetical protein [Nitrososphaeraceae archaeon]